jgi:3-dehydrotetronate 4-kinase
MTPLVIAAWAPAKRVSPVQRQLGTDAANALIEDAIIRAATILVSRDVWRLTVAGDEVPMPRCHDAASVTLRIGGGIDPGVP